MYTVKSKQSGKLYSVNNSDYDDFILYFFGIAPIEQDADGAYLVDDDTIAAALSEHPAITLAI